MHTVSRNCGAAEELHPHPACLHPRLKGIHRKHLRRSPLAECNLIVLWVQSTGLNIDTEHVFRSHYRNCRYAHNTTSTTTPSQSALRAVL